MIKVRLPVFEAKLLGTWPDGTPLQAVLDACRHSISNCTGGKLTTGDKEEVDQELLQSGEYDFYPAGGFSVFSRALTRSL